MGLTLNVPNTFNQNTPLRSVPSGSTAEPDNNVKYVPQTLTEAQQAQARQNIGAAAAGSGGEQIQSDWTQTDDTAVDYIKHKPSIPAAQIQSDWNQSDNTALDYIKNKPTIPALDIPSMINNRNVVKVILDGSSTQAVKLRFRANCYQYSKNTSTIINHTTLDTDFNGILYPGENYFIPMDLTNTQANACSKVEFPSNFTGKAWCYTNITTSGDRIGVCNLGQDVWMIFNNGAIPGQIDDHAKGAILFRIGSNFGWNAVTSMGYPHGVVLGDYDLPNTLSGLNTSFGNWIYIIDKRYNEFVTKLNAAFSSDVVDAVLARTTVYSFINDVEGRLEFVTIG